MNYLSLCSGIEAATQAWHPLGWTAEAFSEIEAFPSAVLAHHYPQTPNLGDMTAYERWNIKPINLLVGGTPCQSFSVAGLRKGLADPRGNLMLTYLAIAARFKPRWIVWENVPGVLSSNGGRDFGTFLGGLAELGYGWAYRVIDAQYCRTLRFPGAVPQRRRRVFVIGYFGDWRRAAAVLFDRESLRGNPPPRREAGEGVAADAGVRAKGGSHWDGTGCHPSLNQSHNTGGIAASNQELFSQRGAGLVMATGQDGAEITQGHAPTLNCNHEAPIAFSEGYFRCGGGHSPRGDGTVNTLQCNTGDQRTAIAIQTANTGANGKNYSEGVSSTLDRASPSAVAFQQNTRDEVRLMGGDGQMAGALAAEAGMKQTNYIAVHGTQDPCTSEDTAFALGRNSGQENALYRHMQVRRLTPEECEALQGFPRGFTRIPWRKKPADQCPDGPRYKALGNSMAVNCMDWIGQRIQHIENLTQ